MALPNGFKWLAPGTLGAVTQLDSVSTGQAKALLVAWGQKEQPNTFPSDYGTSLAHPEDLNPVTWGPRDAQKLHAFSLWWNASGYQPALNEGSSVGGIYYADLTQAHLDALQKWGAGKVQSLPQTPQPWGGCPAGQFLNPATGQCTPIPLLPPGFQFPTIPMPGTTPSAQAVQCAQDCATKFPADPVSQIACLTNCAKQYGPAAQPGGQQPAPPTKPGQPPLPAVPCGPANKCPPGQQCVNGKCVSPTTSSGSVIPWLLGALAVGGGILWAVSASKAKAHGVALSSNPRQLEENAATPIANPCDHDWARDLYKWSLGAYGDTHVYTWANGYEEAEEHMLEWVDEYAPGLLSWAESEEDEVDMIVVGHTTLQHGNVIPSWEVHVDEVHGEKKKAVKRVSEMLCDEEGPLPLP